jgi:hypothetical protein
MYTVTQESWLASKASPCATLDEALGVANRKIAEKAPGTRVTLKNNLTGQVYDEKGILALTSVLNV